MTWFTAQEKKVLLFVFACLFIGMLSSRYFKLNPSKKSIPLPLSLQEKVWMQKQPVDINTADFNQLIRIPGIGPVLAEAILDYRKNSGPFKEIDDLLQIKGIGKKRLEKLEKYLILK